MSIRPGSSVMPGKSTRRAPAGMAEPIVASAAIRPSVMVICGRSMLRPVSTSIMRSAVTTTVSANAGAAVQASAMMAARAKFIDFIQPSACCLALKLSQDRHRRFDCRCQGAEPRWFGIPYPREGDDVFQNVLDIAAGLVIGNVFDPDIGIHRDARQPAGNRVGPGIVGRKAQGQMTAISIQQLAQVCGA